MCSPDCFLLILAIIFPPVAVWVKRGLCSADSLINIALCCLGFFPGLLHAWYIVAKYPDDYEYEGVSDVEDPRNQAHPVWVVPGPQQQQRHAQHAGYAPPPQQPQYNTFGGPVLNSGPAGSSSAPPPQHHDAAGGPPPPSYSSIVKGDNKVQNDE